MSTVVEKRFRLQFGMQVYELSSRTYIMGILNVTPDSFSDAGRFYSVNDAVDHALEMVEQGVDFIDVGGESTRPGSDPVPLDEELNRVVPVIEKLAKQIPVPISIDTYKAPVAQEALKAGAVIVNDIGALTFDPGMIEVITKHQASVILMHIKGTPKTMQQNPEYGDVVKEVYGFLETQARRAAAAGVNQIVIDPGIGFGKNLNHNIELIRRLGELRRMHFPILIGPSRKSFIGTILDLPVTERLEGTAAAVTACIMNGANIVRVHDVREMKRVAKVADALKRTNGGT